MTKKVVDVGLKQQYGSNKSLQITLIYGFLLPNCKQKKLQQQFIRIEKDILKQRDRNKVDVTRDL
jgi:hypothetical protein